MRLSVLKSDYFSNDRMILILKNTLKSTSNEKIFFDLSVNNINFVCLCVMHKIQLFQVNDWQALRQYHKKNMTIKLQLAELI